MSSSVVDLAGSGEPLALSVFHHPPTLDDLVELLWTMTSSPIQPGLFQVSLFVIPYTSESSHN